MPEALQGLIRRDIASDSASGYVLTRQIRAGLQASFCDVTYTRDTILRADVPPSVFIGVLVGRDASNLRVSGTGTVDILPHIPLVARLPTERECIGMHKSGARCLNVGLSLSHECIQSMLEDYGEESMGAIARFPEVLGICALCTGRVNWRRISTAWSHPPNTMAASAHYSSKVALWPFLPRSIASRGRMTEWSLDGAPRAG